ncbi:MAG: hypothetical protein U1E78_04990 [Gammaproteobacteria bacterium]
MAAVGLTNNASVADKEKICLKCKQRKDTIFRNFNFDGYSIKSFLSADDYIEIDSILESVTQQDFHKLSIDDIEIGKIALYQAILELKKISLEFKDEQWIRVKIDLKNTLMTFFAVRKIFWSEKPDIVILYNSLYSVNHVVCKLAQKYQIRQYFMHASGSLAHKSETMILGEGDAFKYYKKLLKFWEVEKYNPCSISELKQVSMHIIAAIRASTLFSYSIKVGKEQPDVISYFQVKRHQKILLATMSSNDERYAANIINAFHQSENVLFQTQTEWLAALINYVKPRRDLFLIIRVHPREFPNRRESVKSENSSQLESLLLNLPENVKVNWPSDGISLYHLAQEIDLCLNSWSSAGKELAALGIPVLLYSKEIQVYPADINYLAEDIDSYFLELEKALKNGWSFENVRKAYRWYAVEYFRTTLDLSDSFRNVNSNLINRVLRKIITSVFDSGLDYLDCKRRARSLKTSSIIREIIEKGKDSYLDILSEKRNGPHGHFSETSALKSILYEIYMILKRNNRKMTPLLINIKNYIDLDAGT